MRRTTSTWTAAILGAALSTQAVLAQQSPTAATAKGTTSAAESDPSFGMAAARGARNLLRNGLDYIDYQEFDRALKYLREAERRQDELNEPERQKLKEGIERAQRGLREAIGTEEPYALSERSTRSTGGSSSPTVAAASTGRFAVAKPQAAATSKREGDDRGEPIQLAGAEVVVPPPPRGDDPIPASPSAPRIEVSPALADAPLELADVEIPTPPPINRIEAPTATPKSSTQAPKLDDAAMAQADLLAPLPDFDRLDVPPPSLGPLAPREDVAVQLSNTEREQAESESASEPATIFLENPNELDEMEAPAALDIAPSADMDGFNLPPLGHDAIKAVAPESADVDEVDIDEIMNPAPIATPEAPAPRMGDDALDLPALPADLQDSDSFSIPTSRPTADEPMIEPEPEFDLEAEVETEFEAATEPETDAMPQPAPVDDEPDELPELPDGLGDMGDDDGEPRLAAAPEDEPIAPSVEEMSFDDELPDEAPAVAPAVDELAEPAPEFLPAPAPRAEESADSFAPRRSAPKSTLSPELQSRVEEVARKMEAEYREAQITPQPQPSPADFEGESGDSYADDLLRTQTQIDISRAPSPAEARPINAIPVPEDWVPLGAREWSPQRKYWAAAATCHMPLYFQDPMLERYGHSVEKFLGPAGRYFAYPVDNHTQTTQRNQILQPFASAGLFAFQILTWPYALIMDPPWEAQYDLGYWRPGDKIPTDLYYLPLHGTGPPLKGRNY